MESLLAGDTQPVEKQQRYLVYSHLQMMSDLLMRSLNRRASAASVITAALSIVERVTDLVGSEQEERPGTWIATFPLTDLNAVHADLLALIESRRNDHSNEVREDATLVTIRATIERLRRLALD